MPSPPFPASCLERSALATQTKQPQIISSDPLELGSAAWLTMGLWNSAFPLEFPQQRPLISFHKQKEEFMDPQESPWPGTQPAVLSQVSCPALDIPTPVCFQPLTWHPAVQGLKDFRETTKSPTLSQNYLQKFPPTSQSLF